MGSSGVKEMKSLKSPFFVEFPKSTVLFLCLFTLAKFITFNIQKILAAIREFSVESKMQMKPANCVSLVNYSLALLYNQIGYSSFEIGERHGHLMTSSKFYLWVHINKTVVVSRRATAWAICTDGVILVRWNRFFRTAE